MAEFVNHRGPSPPIDPELSSARPVLRVEIDAMLGEAHLR